MRRLQRLPLSPPSLDFLQGRAREVQANENPRARAKALWDVQNNRTFREIKQTLRAMASGIERCMYCEDSAGIAIEHFWPKAIYPDRAFVWENYLLACTECNSHKRQTFPLDEHGDPLLVNPVEEEPLDHLAFSPSTGKYEPLTRKGEQSEGVYGLGRAPLVRGRLLTWEVLKSLLCSYSQLQQAGRLEEARRKKDAVRQLQFSGVFAAFLRIAKGPAAEILIGLECLQALRDHPEIETWLQPESQAIQDSGR